MFCVLDFRESLTDCEQMILFVYMLSWMIIWVEKLLINSHIRSIQYRLREEKHKTAYLIGIKYLFTLIAIYYSSSSFLLISQQAIQSVCVGRSKENAKLAHGNNGRQYNMRLVFSMPVLITTKCRIYLNWANYYFRENYQIVWNENLVMGMGENLINVYNQLIWRDDSVFCYYSRLHF